MARFDYTALTADGAPVTGSRRARTLGEARRAAAARGLHRIHLTERVRRGGTVIGGERITGRRLHRLLQQLAVFARSGLPLVDALQVLVDESEDRTIRQALLGVIADLRAGTSLAEALGRHPEMLRPHHIGIIRAAEMSGRLAEAFDDIALDTERELEMRSAIRSAATYPVFVLALAGITVMILAVVVLPRFQTLFDDLGADPPAVTRILLGLVAGVDAIPAFGWVVMLLTTAMTIVSITRPRGRRLRDRVMLATPGVGVVVRLATQARLCRVLGTALRNGVPLPVGVEAAALAVRHHVLRERVTRAHARIMSGHGLSRSFDDLDVFTPAVRQMIVVGETTGTIVDQLDLAARHADDELRHRIDRLTSRLEPTMILGVGLVVGFVAVALVSAMYGLIGDVGSDVTP